MGEAHKDKDSRCRRDHLPVRFDQPSIIDYVRVGVRRSFGGEKEVGGGEINGAVYQQKAVGENWRTIIDKVPRGDRTVERGKNQLGWRGTS